MCDFPIKMLLQIHTAWIFIKIISIPNEESFSNTAVGFIASYFVNVVSVGFVASLSPAVVNCFICDRRRVAFIDIEWFVLFLLINIHSLHEKYSHHTWNYCICNSSIPIIILQNKFTKHYFNRKNEAIFSTQCVMQDALSIHYTFHWIICGGIDRIWNL